MSLPPHEELESTAPWGENREGEAPQRRFGPSLPLESNGEGGLESLGSGRGMARGESERAGGGRVN